MFIGHKKSARVCGFGFFLLIINAEDSSRQLQRVCQAAKSVANYANGRPLPHLPPLPPPPIDTQSSRMVCLQQLRYTKAEKSGERQKAKKRRAE